MTVTIYHNPACGTSRNTPAMIRESGEQPTVIDYLETPPSRERLVSLIESMNVPVRAVMREREAVFSALNLADPSLSDHQLIDAIIAHPILMNRPIVATSNGARLCRPSELVLDLLESPVTSFVKEDGEIVGPPRP